MREKTLEDQYKLFCTTNLSEELQRRFDLIADRVNEIRRDQFMNTHTDALADHVRDVLLVNPLMLHEDQKTLEEREITIKPTGLVVSKDGVVAPRPYPGVLASVSIPYSGHGWLWYLQPSQLMTTFPIGHLEHNNPTSTGTVLLMKQQHIDLPHERIKEWIDQELATLRSYVQAQKEQVEAFNARLRDSIISAVVARRERIKRLDGLPDLLAIPLKKKAGVPEIEPIAMTRRLIRPLPPVPQGGYRPEPGVPEDEYAQMVKIIRHAGRTFEATPATYAKLDEPDLRNIVLAHLNTHYEGEATGETFRGRGKTDIRIEVDNRAAFVAECKLWRGAKEIGGAVDQLLGYLTWRDCKAAIVIFNKDNAKFTSILEAIPAAFTSHRLYKRHSEVHEQGEWQFDMTSAEDEGRQVRVHVFVFNLFVR